ncbi:energy transducer TonB [Sulfurimonas sp.]|uniref:energy transducer TonB n=1 Tax=Sulfurimonas sp. TaxID=2022749 RepID=UPI0025E50DB6|nr:energy transducer TonB [Sulfurimonas sp.]MDD5157159.1 TonB family protein [Sulfurimonas sp.]
MNIKTLISNNKKALIASLIFHIILIALYFFYFYSFQKKEQGKIAIPMKCICNCDMPKCPMNKNKKLQEPKKSIVKESVITQKIVVKKQAIQEAVSETSLVKKEFIQEKIIQIQPAETKLLHLQPTKAPSIEQYTHEITKKSEPITPKQIQKEQDDEFMTTNFSSIRDMATKNLYYPNRAQKMGWGGTTEIKMIIDTNGKLLDATINKSSGRELLDNSALESVLSLKDEILPKPKKVTTLILPISFSIKK